MTFYEQLVGQTTPHRKAFLAIPLIVEAVGNGVDRALYREFLTSAWHHVRYTVPLLEAARAACTASDGALAAGLDDYIDEERGHDEWILQDITAMGGDGEAVRHSRPPLAVEVMVATAFHRIATEGPYSLLGMVHVLEGMSVALATRAAGSIRQRLAGENGGASARDSSSPEGDSQAGFSYLTSHGSLDIGHVSSFATLLEAVDTPDRRETVIAAARTFYQLYGDVFRALGKGETDHAA